MLSEVIKKSEINSKLLRAVWKQAPGGAFDIQRDAFRDYIDRFGPYWGYLISRQCREDINETNKT